MKEKYFKDYDEFWDYLLDYNCIKNSKNFCRFSLEKISENKIHLEDTSFYKRKMVICISNIKLLFPKNKIIAYANVIHKKGLENDNRNTQ